MYELKKYVRFMSGSPQFRIVELSRGQAKEYEMYSQKDLMEDLTGIEDNCETSKKIYTNDIVSTLDAGDTVFGLISGYACVVGEAHKGFLYTQNYIKICPNENLDPSFLVYLLNQDRKVRKQLRSGLQGSSVLKYTLKQLKEIRLPSLPALEIQRGIGEVYLKQTRVEALKKRRAEEEKLFIFSRLEEILERTCI